MTSTETTATISIGIADDDPLVRRTLTGLLSGTGQVHVAWTAKDGQEALELIRSPDTPPVQALLLDVQMPRTDGLVLTQILHKEVPDLAVLILTAFATDSVMEKAMAAGVRGVVAKDDDIGSLVGAIQQAVAGNFVMSPTCSAVVAEHLRPDGAHSTSHSSPSSPGKSQQHASAALPSGVTLTAREQEILALLAESLTNKQIARRLTLSQATVKAHVSAIIAKLGVRDRVGAVVYALNNHLL
ncbi:DNA-binding response regulator [Actinomyces lilanjuaniae]|uniref:DNA-binding response regulator n=1 Tax=Actinomyces lilanjuaniae TaxID=2321394 RepID=A0ABN5PMQ6_9ACTO|nr:response regulator transcription factor [Actinomyces lilanjuaniae]AYD88893.1 DNA-binding response regulator [Actinomyces lilanjuaniae]